MRYLTKTSLLATGLAFALTGAALAQGTATAPPPPRAAAPPFRRRQRPSPATPPARCVAIRGMARPAR
jgi:hypothetical protein